MEDTEKINLFYKEVGVETANTFLADPAAKALIPGMDLPDGETDIDAFCGQISPDQGAALVALFEKHVPQK